MIALLKLLIGKININYALIGLVISLAVITLLWRLEVSSHKLTKAEYEANAQAQKAKNAIELKQRENITNQVLNSYNDSINKLKEYYANNPHIKYRTVRLQDATTCGVPTEDTSASRIDTDTNGIDEAIATELAGEVQIDFEQAGKEIVQCLELIKFNKEQDAVK